MVDETFEPCPIVPVIDAIFGRWTAPILWTLHRHGRLRFTGLQQQLPEITPKVLAHRLKQLERDGLVTRTQYAEVPPRVEYEETDLSRSLSPVFDALHAWAVEHIDDLLRARQGILDHEPETTVMAPSIGGR